MPKATKQGGSSTPFQFARQFTAPPFFVGMEDAKMKGRLLLNAVAESRRSAVKPKPKKTVAKNAKVKTKSRKS